MRHKHSIRVGWIALGIGLLLWIAGPPAGEAQPMNESQVEAAYLYNFVKFVSWPAGTFANATDPIRLCILSDEPFQLQLNQIVKGKTIAGHPVLVVPVQNGEQARSCQELFIRSSQKRDTMQILESLHGTSVLTIGEVKGFVEQGGIISFILQGEHVHFQVNQKAANQAGLRLSSQLLSVAQAVTE
jgi:hypothetical protein